MAKSCRRNAALWRAPPRPPAAAEVAAAGVHLQQLAPLMAHGCCLASRQAAGQGQQGQQRASWHSDGFAGGHRGMGMLGCRLQEMLGRRSMANGRGELPALSSCGVRSCSAAASFCSDAARCIVQTTSRRRHAVTDMAQERGSRPTVEVLLAPELIAAAQASPVRFKHPASVCKHPHVLPALLLQGPPPPRPGCRHLPWHRQLSTLLSAPAAGAHPLAAACAAAADRGAAPPQCAAEGAQVSCTDGRRTDGAACAQRRWARPWPWAWRSGI